MLDKFLKQNKTKCDIYDRVLYFQKAYNYYGILELLQGLNSPFLGSLATIAISFVILIYQ